MAYKNNRRRMNSKWEFVAVISALFVPIVLACVFRDEWISVLVATSFCFALTTQSFFNMKKDRDSWKRSFELNKALLEEERKKTS